MTRPRRSRALCRLEISAAFDMLRQDIARTDALLCASEHQLERAPWNAKQDEDDADDDDDDQLRLEHLSQLLGAAKESARAAVHLAAQIAAEFDKRGAGS
jgi:hypothetical protein